MIDRLADGLLDTHSPPLPAAGRPSSEVSLEYGPQTGPPWVASRRRRSSAHTPRASRAVPGQRRIVPAARGEGRCSARVTYD
jgi:hypothetical protein